MRVMDLTVRDALNKIGAGIVWALIGVAVLVYG